MGSSRKTIGGKTSMREVRIQSVDEFIDSQPGSSHQRRIIFFGFLAAALDAFDAACA
jgi:hypothetical protein